MKKTQVLFKHHIGRMIRRHWYIQGKIKVNPTPAEDILKSLGYEVVDVKEYLGLPEVVKKINNIEKYDEQLPKDHMHPDYDGDSCFILRDCDVLIDGLEQAKALTNTVEITEGLPACVVESEEKLNLSNQVHSEVMKKIKLSCMLEATQEKLPKKKDPLRPSWVLKREFGILETKKNDLLCKNLVTICEQSVKNFKNRSIISDAFFSTPIEAHNKKLLFETTSELLVTSRKRLNSMAELCATYDFSVPNLHPMDCTAGIKPYNSYVMQDIYPPGTNSKWPFVQNVILHFNRTQVKNIIEEEVTESQIQSRSLLKGFSIAAAEAHAIYGPEVKELPEPLVVPVIQTDGKMFHFSIFQLNTLNLDRNLKAKNIFWNSLRIPLYEVCEYQGGRPVLKGYNPDVIRKLITFFSIE